MFGHRICDVCIGIAKHRTVSSPVVVTLTCSASTSDVLPEISCLPGDGLTEESYREKMFEKSEEREEMRQALVSEGEDTRLAVYAEVHGEEAASTQRSSKPERKKKKKKSKKKKAEEEEAEEYAEGDGEDEYVDEDAAELARMAQEERLAQMQENGEEGDEGEQDDGDDDDDEYGGME